MFWFAPQVQGRHQELVATALRGRGDRESVWVRDWIDRAWIIAPLFPRFAFCGRDRTLRLSILTTPGVLSSNPSPAGLDLNRKWPYLPASTMKRLARPVTLPIAVPYAERWRHTRFGIATYRATLRGVRHSSSAIARGLDRRRRTGSATNSPARCEVSCGWLDVPHPSETPFAKRSFVHRKAQPEPGGNGNWSQLLLSVSRQSGWCCSR